MVGIGSSRRRRREDHLESERRSQPDLQLYRRRWWHCRYVSIAAVGVELRSLPGLALASRLAEVSSNKILVIEAGPDARNDPVINDPGQ